MEGYLRDVKKLSLICVLSTSITEGSLLSGSIFSDIRTSLYSRMLEVIKQRWEPLNLYKYLSPGVMPTLFMDWVFEQMKKYQDKDEANEEKQITPMQDNNLFGNAYAGTPPPKKKKKLKEASYKDYMVQAQAARDRLKQKQENRKKKDAAYVDLVKKGVKFYDKKGSGRLVKGKKVYD